MSKILIVEDDEMVAKIYGTKFRSAGFEVQVAPDGEAAIARLSEAAPDLVLLDLMLPKVNGVEVLKHIRRKAALLTLPVVVFTNAYLIDLVRQAWRAGADSCLIKADCTPAVVLEVIRKFLAPPAPPALGESEFTLTTATPSTPTIPFLGARELLATLESGPEAPPEYEPRFPEEVLQRAPRTVANIKALLRDFVQDRDFPTRLPKLEQTHAQVRSLAGNAGAVGFQCLAHFASAFEALLKGMCEAPEDITPSEERTLSQAADCLAAMVEQAPALEAGGAAPPHILVVDDEPLFLKMICLALMNASLKPTTAEDPLTALRMLEQAPFDLVVLDVNMPQMDGFELCRRLRAIPAHAKTPVVFVTVLNDFDDRIRSVISGGDDLIGKPFQPLELTVKVLLYIAQARLAARA